MQAAAEENQEIRTG